MAIRKTFGNKDAEIPKRGQKILMNTLEKSRKTNEFLRGDSRNTSGGTKAPKGDRAAVQRGKSAGGTRPPGGGPVQPAQKGGLPEVRRTTQPVEYKKPSTSVTEYKKPSRSVTEYKKPSTSVTEYKKPGTAVTEYKKPSTSITEYKKPMAGGGAIRKTESVLDKAKRYAKGPIGLSGAALGFYLGDTFSSKTGNQANYGEQAWIDDKKNRGPLMKGGLPAAGKTDREDKSGGGSSGPRDDRASSGGGTFKPINRDNLSEQGKKTFDAKQGQKKKPAVQKAVPKAGPKAGSTKKADKPLNIFERGKKRRYENEGFGGRSMTSRGAESRVKKERSYKFKDLFKKKK